jgi:hypothetical protein
MCYAAQVCAEMRRTIAANATRRSPEGDPPDAIYYGTTRPDINTRSNMPGKTALLRLPGLQLAEFVEFAP